MALLDEAEGFWADHLFACWESGAWHTQPAEDQIYGQLHLGEHLQAASGPSRRLFTLVSADWMRAWQATEGGYRGFLRDVDRAWARADQSIASSPVSGSREPASEAGDLVMQVHCSACHSSVVALSAKVHPELLGLLVDHKTLSFAQALNIVGSAPAGYERINLWTALLPLVPPEFKNEVLREAIRIEPLTDRVSVLCGMIPTLDPRRAEAAWREAMDAARREGDPSFREQNERKVAECVPASIAEEGLKVARRVHDSRTGYLLKHIAPRLSESLIDDALDIADKISDDSGRFEALFALAECLPAERRPAVFQRAHAAASRIRSIESRAEALSRLSPHITEQTLKTDLKQALEQVVKSDGYGRYHALVGLAPMLVDNLLEKAHEIAIQKKDDSVWSTRAIVAVADRSPAAFLRLSLDAVRKFTDVQALAEGLIGLAKLADESQRASIHAEAMDAVAKIPAEWARAQVLLDALEVPSPIPDRAEEIARGIQDPAYRSKAFTRLAIQTRNDKLAKEAVACALSIRDRSDKVEAIIDLIPALLNDARDDALSDLLRSFRKSKADQDNPALMKLIPILPEKLMERALAAAGRMPESDDAASALCEAAPRLSPAMMKRAIDIARRIADPYQRGRVLGHLAAHCGSAAESVFKQAFAASAEIGDGAERKDARDKLATAQTDAHKTTKTPVVPIVSEGSRETEAALLERYRFLMTDGEVIEDAPGWIETMQELVPQLPMNLRAEATRDIYGVIIGATLDRSEYSRALNGLLPIAEYLGEPSQRQVFDTAIEAASQQREERWQAVALSEIVPLLPEPRRSQAARLALDASRYQVHEDNRVPILTDLAPYLSGELLETAVLDALALTEPSLRQRALEALALRLSGIAATELEFAYDCWKVMLHRFAELPRHQMAGALGAVGSVAVALDRETGRNDVAAQFSKVIDEVAQWWP